MSTQPMPNQPRHFGIPPTTALGQIQNPLEMTADQPFHPLPAPTGPYPYRLALADVIGAPGPGTLTFHCVGDTGGIKDPHPQLAVAAALTADLANGPRPAFLYHLGDVVYFNGDESEYGPQFYEPYVSYNVPIFAIPGNHDGDNSDDPSIASLSAFVQNFCSATPHVDPRFHEYNRDTMDQPNVYWTLQAPPYLTIIGLYTNVPSGGAVHRDQSDWLASELAAADPALPVVVALHHPPLSGDSHHGSCPAMGVLLDQAFRTSGRTADLVLSGHVHNYQRFTRTIGDRQIPYIVAGAGGYHNLHAMAAGATAGMTAGPGIILNQFCDDKWGFLRLSVENGRISGQYIVLAADDTPTVVDTFSLQARS
ncbi:metallophosphoesterase family protein [Nocardia sp. NPDC051570]|uniref:metallophosphoesterase family protein n=1 Tax=Nocardia sp. NPDC051570 TaxID=3364324 RepID=UPI0037AE7AB6